MGLLCKTQGKLEVDGEFAYVSQEPFIFNETLRDNILFGKEMHTATLVFNQTFIHLSLNLIFLDITVF